MMGGESKNGNSTTTYAVYGTSEILTLSECFWQLANQCCLAFGLPNRYFSHYE